MKSTARAVSILIALLAPALAFAQQPPWAYPMLPTPNGGYSTTGYLNSSSWGFSGGTGFGGFGFGGLGLGGFGGGYGGGLAGFGIGGIAGNILFIINGVLVPVLFAISFIVFLYGIARAYIFSTGDPDKVKEGHHIILWGLIGFAVMISLWGLVNVVVFTFGLQGQFAPFQPTSYAPIMGPLGQ
ncbi:MAG: hypothetical protein KGH56_03570 [Patescibacteria group bacterium]|nr:hypothetical protein [Patescibacteria group bacterium]